MALRKVSQDELQNILSEHKLWIETNSISGKRANLEYTDLRNLNLSALNLSQVNLNHSDLSFTNLYATQLISTDLSYSNLSSTDLRLSNLSSSKLCNTDFISANLYSANLSNSIINHSDFSHADLASVTFHNSNLTYSCLKHANLIFANFLNVNLSNSNLFGVKLDFASLRNVNLYECILSFSIFYETIIVDTDFRRCKTDGTNFSNVDLSKALNLETVIHSGPSTIGIDTLYLSNGKIPIEFLRGCGVPETLITYLPSLLNSPFSYQSCFISYCQKDSQFVHQLHSVLQDKGVRCWLDDQDGKPGDFIHSQIDEAINLRERFILVLTEESMKSEWVKRELIRAFRAEKKILQESNEMIAARKTKPNVHIKKFLPIRLVPFESIKNWVVLDPDSGENVVDYLKKYLISDFTEWNNDMAFQESLRRVLEALKVPEG